MLEDRRKKIISHFKEYGAKRYSYQENQLLSFYMFERAVTAQQAERHMCIKNVAAIVCGLRNKGHYITMTTVGPNVPAYMYHGYLPELARAYNSKELDVNTGVTIFKSILKSFPSMFESVENKLEKITDLDNLRALLILFNKRKSIKDDAKFVCEIILKAINDFESAIKLRQIAKGAEKKARPNQSKSEQA